MKKTRVIVLGAGISGLSLAWYLSQLQPKYEITVLEKASRAGNWMNTDHSMGFLFERGPRTFKASRCHDLLQMCVDLGIQQEIIASDAKTHHRYLWINNELRQFPANPFAMLASPLTRRTMFALLKEWSIAPSVLEDETIADFITRRFSADTARNVFNPLTVGIYAGDCNSLSIRSCFPKLKQWEDRFGSITKGLFSSLFNPSEERQLHSSLKQLKPSSFFSFKSGVETVVRELTRHLEGNLHLNEEVKEVAFAPDHVEVFSSNRKFEADYLFFALPPHAAAQLLHRHDPETSAILSGVNYSNITVVNLGYEKDVLPMNGYGYLIPTYENEKILGAVFDSKVFPQQNKHPHETRLTVKIKGTAESDEYYVKTALEGLKRHLNLQAVPDKIAVKKAEKAIPQYAVGHLRKMQELEEKFAHKFPRSRLVGNYLAGVSVNECIAKAKKAVEEFAQMPAFAQAGP